MLWLCIHLPQLAVEVFCRGLDVAVPLVVAEGRGSRARVCACNHAAALLGIAPGMALGAAHALAGDLRVRERNIMLEEAALAHVAAWSGQFTSVVSVRAPTAVLLEIGGSLALLGTPESLRARVHSGMAELGYAPIVAVAPTPLGAAWLAGAGVAVCCTEHDAFIRYLGRIPLCYSGMDAKSVELLQGAGVRVLADVLRLPRAGLARRVGPAVLLAVDRALGRVADPQAPFVLPRRYAGRLPLPAPVDETHALVFAVQRLLRELCGLLLACCSGVQELVLRLVHDDAGMTDVRLMLTIPGRDVRGLSELLRYRLERLTLTAPVVEMHLVVDTFLPWLERSDDLFVSPHDTDEARYSLVARLAARLGDAAVHGLCAAPEHRPEHAWCVAPPGMVQAGVPRTTAPRPVWLLVRPQPLPAVNGHPCLEGTLVLAGERERIEGGWWEGRDSRRDYFIGRTAQGAHVWVFRAAGVWFLHGIFD